MYRLLVAILACAVVAGFGAVPLNAEEVGHLDEMVPWPMMCASIAGESLVLGPSLTSGIGCSDCPGGTRYGVLKLGDGTDAGTACAVLEFPDSPPLLRLDTDNDQELADDAWLHFDVQVGPRAFEWYVTTLVKFASTGSTIRVPYRVVVHAEYSYEMGDYEWFYAGFSHREGFVDIGGRSYAIAVASVTTTGTYSDLSSLVVAVDIDQDGTLDTLPYSNEVFGPGEALVLPTGAYRVSSMSSDGLTIHLDRQGDSVPRPVIARGGPAPAFSTIDLNGETVSVPDYLSVATVLVFVPSLGSGPRSSSCTTCSGTSDFSARAADVLNAISDLGGRVTLVVVSGAPDPVPLAQEPQSRVRVHVVYDPSVNALYRRTTVGAFVMDGNRMIVAMDEVWSTIKDGVPHGAYAELRPFDIRYAVEQLLRQ